MLTHTSLTQSLIQSIKSINQSIIISICTMRTSFNYNDLSLPRVMINRCNWMHSITTIYHYPGRTSWCSPCTLPPPQPPQQYFISKEKKTRSSAIAEGLPDVHVNEILQLHVYRNYPIWKRLQSTNDLKKCTDKIIAVLHAFTCRWVVYITSC